MTREEIKDKLAEIMIMAMPDAADLVKNCDEQSNLHTDLGLNSVGMLFMVIAIEEFFAVELGNLNFNDFQTVSDVIDYIEQQQAA